MPFFHNYILAENETRMIDVRLYDEPGKRGGFPKGGDTFTSVKQGHEELRRCAMSDRKLCKSMAGVYAGGIVVILANLPHSWGQSRCIPLQSD